MSVRFQFLKSNWASIFTWVLTFAFTQTGLAQQVIWAKVYPLQKTDYIKCVTRDENYIYAGGNTRRNAPGSSYTKAILIKLDLNGDTIFVKDLGIHGTLTSMLIDPWGVLRLNVEQVYAGSPDAYYNYLIRMTPEGFAFKIDTIPRYALNACMIGKDSSLIVVGSKRRTGGAPSETSMYFWRMDKYGILDPWVELNPGHPNCVANRVEQLPNGHYLISGSVGSRVASYEVNEDGSNPVFYQWYQTPDFTNLYAGYAGRLGHKNWMIGAQGNPSFVAHYDSLKQKVWRKEDPAAILAPPQAMTDGSVVFGYRSGLAPYNFFYRFSADSTLLWYFNMRDSLTQRDLPGAVNVLDYTYFEDQSAIFAGTYNQDTGAPTDTKDDPIFLRIANVGTPVTSLIKPKKGPLANETLAPWPNPTSGTLYLKQHFDKAEIHLYNLSGKEMGNFQIGFAQPIDVSGYASGVYLYRAVIDGKFYSGKIIRN